MILNKYNKKYMYHDKYHDKKILKIGKKELYPFVYKREWDLTQYDKKILEYYGLYKAIYVYIGSSNKYNLKARCSQWRNDILNNTKNVSKDISSFIFKLKLFYESETSYTDKEINDLLYYNAIIISRCQSLQGARKLEKGFTTKYHYLDFCGEILEPHTILLSKIDSNLKEVKDSSLNVIRNRNIKPNRHP